MKISDIISVIVIFILSMVIFRQCKKGDTIIETTDTVTVVRIDTLIIEKEVPVEKIRRIEVPTYIYTDSSDFRIYKDTTYFDKNFYVHYTARVDGFLDEIWLGLYDNRPDSIIWKTQTNTITNTKYVYPSGFYLGGSISPNDYTTGAAYQWKRNFVSLGYDWSNKGIRVGYYYRIK